MAEKEKELELDELQEDEANIPDENGEEPTQERRKIFTDKLDPSVGDLFTLWQDGDLVLDPIFQRRKVWDDKRQSKLIESVLLEVPLPIFYFAESQNGTLEVIDGQQRLTALFHFLDNQYALKGLKKLDLNGAKFQGLKKPMQKFIRRYALRTITFKKESDENLRFEIFERLNTGAVPLNDQELRNCMYRGSYNQLLIQLASDPDYMWLMGLKRPEKRMKDVEYVLRFAAFYHATYLHYKPSMANFLNEEMKKYQNISKSDAENLRVAFKRSVTLVRSLLGQNAFRRYYRGDNAATPNGRWESKKFNASLYDISMYCFADADKNLVMANLDAIREALIVLMTENQEFIEAIELSTSATRMVKRRFDAWRLTLDAILAQTQKQPRCFSKDLKKQLWKANPECKLCGNQINDVDDAAVDHIEMYWLGGKTIPENAHLTHRYCNWARPKHT
jgi:Protein of unknown function DUF262/HNH endonuclease